jgi:hypothetical protein
MNIIVVAGPFYGVGIPELIILLGLIVLAALIVAFAMSRNPKVGKPLALESLSPDSRQEVYSRLIFATSAYSGGYFDGVQVTTDGIGAITIERRYVPTWAIVVAVIGFFAFFLGPLALLYRVREVCQITLSDQQDGTLIRVDGVLGNNQHNIVNATIASLS